MYKKPWGVFGVVLLMIVSAPGLGAHDNDQDSKRMIAVRIHSTPPIIDGSPFNSPN